MTHKIALIPGDGIGQEVVDEGVRALDALSSKFGFEMEYTQFDYSCDRYLKTGAMMPEDGIERLKAFDAILLGAVGDYSVPDHISLWGLLIPIRRQLQLYANVRPVKLLPGIKTPLANRTPEEIDFVIVRENCEGEYSETGGRIYSGTENEVAIQEAIFTKRGVDRVMRYAFNLAMKRGKHLTAATKSNGIIHTMPFWDERFADIAQEFPEVKTDKFHIDILTAHFVQHPDWFDVIVGSNLFADILSDLGPAVAGGIGIAPSANLNPEREFPSLFEPVHGSAPDIAGKGVANPLATLWSVSMMLDFLGEEKAGAALLKAIEETAAAGDVFTPDLGGKAKTNEFTDAVIGRF